MEEELPIKPSSPSIRIDGWIALISATACLVFVTFSSNGKAEQSNTTKSKPAWAASRAFSIEWCGRHYGVVGTKVQGKTVLSRMLRTNAAIW